MMSNSLYSQALSQIRRLVELDQRIDTLEMEALGGETTLMPYSFWEHKLPETIDMLKDFRRSKGVRVDLVFVTNGIFPDKKYIDLFNSYKNEPLFELTTSWDLDTNRFGSKDRLMPRFIENMASLLCDKNILITLTQDTLKLTASDLVEKILGPAGIDSMNFNLLVPSGTALSGQHRSPPKFDDVATYVESLDEQFNNLGLAELLFIEDHKDTLLSGGNDSPLENSAYAMSILPDGSTAMAATLMGEQIEPPRNRLSIADELWPMKALFENSVRIAKTINVLRDECSQCEFYFGCKGGSLYYRDLVETDLDKYECIGGKALWKHVNKSTSIGQWSLVHLQRQIKTKSLHANSYNGVCEASMADDYDSFLETISTLPLGNRIHLVPGEVFNLSLLERIFFYDSLALPVDIPFSEMNIEDAAIIIRHQVYLNTQIELATQGDVLEFIVKYPEILISKQITTAHQALREHMASSDHVEKQKLVRDEMYLDERNEDLFIWVALNLIDTSTFTDSSPNLNDDVALFLSRVITESIVARGYERAYINSIPNVANDE
jgi:hypothetical protein